MDYFTSSRNQVVLALAKGEPVSSDQAARFPDVILDKDASQIPDWLLPYIRRPSPPDGPRYVVADGQPFHVSVTGGGPLVCEVEFFNSGGIRKVRHNPFRPTVEKIHAAVTAYKTVNEFIRDPNAFHSEFVGLVVKDKVQESMAATIHTQEAAIRTSDRDDLLDTQAEDSEPQLGNRISDGPGAGVAEHDAPRRRQNRRTTR